MFFFFLIGQNDDLIVNYAKKAMSVPTTANIISKNETTYTADPTTLIKGTILMLGFNSFYLCCFLSKNAFFHSNNLEKGAEFFISNGQLHMLSTQQQQPDAQQKQKMWILTGDLEKDNNMRRSHFFTGSPSLILAKNLLQLCSEPKKAADCCIEICDRLSHVMLDNNTSNQSKIDNVISINTMRELLLYAKQIFLNMPPNQQSSSISFNSSTTTTTNVNENKSEVVAPNKEEQNSVITSNSAPISTNQQENSESNNNVGSNTASNHPEHENDSTISQSNIDSTQKVKTEGISLCDSFLNYVQLIQSLLVAKALPSNFYLKDFNDPQKARSFE